MRRAPSMDVGYASKGNSESALPTNRGVISNATIVISNATMNLKSFLFLANQKSKWINEAVFKSNGKLYFSEENNLFMEFRE